ncbi:hypothetical protein J3E68DRAFT_383511 [Trichoderma sp. SZMC 28012]
MLQFSTSHHIGTIQYKSILFPPFIFLYFFSKHKHLFILIFFLPLLPPNDMHTPNQTLLGLCAISHPASRRHSASASTYILHKAHHLQLNSFNSALVSFTLLLITMFRYSIYDAHPLPSLSAYAVLRSNPRAHPTPYEERHRHRQSATHRLPLINQVDIEQTSPKRRHRNQTRNIISSVVAMLYNASYTTYDFLASSRRSRPHMPRILLKYQSIKQKATNKCNDAARFQQKIKASANPVVTGPNSPAPLLSTQNVHGPRT